MNKWQSWFGASCESNIVQVNYLLKKSYKLSNQILFKKNRILDRPLSVKEILINFPNKADNQKQIKMLICYF